MNGDLADTALGLVGAAVFATTYSYSPAMAFGLVGFHIGVMTMRMTRGYFILASKQKTPQS